MPTFHYSASGGDQKAVRGVRDASDRADLARQLEAEGLLLISARAEEEPPPRVFGVPYRPPVSGLLQRRLNAGDRNRALALAIFVSAALFLAILNWPSQVDPLTRHVRELTQHRLAPGTPRRAVDSLLVRQKDPSSRSDLTIYGEPPDLLYEIPFDSTGGPWSPENRIRGLVIVRRSRPHES